MNNIIATASRKIKQGYKVLSTKYNSFAQKRLTTMTAINKSLQYASLVYEYNNYKYPDVIIGYMPLYGVQNLEIANSQDVLKYRSVKGEFMAHQHGGNTAVRIDMILTGPNQDIQLFALKGLLFYGDETIEHGTNISNVGYTSTGTIVGNTISTTGTITKGYMDTSLPGYAYYDMDDLSFLDQKYHRTFPIFTRGEILFDMYIETLVASRNVKAGIGITEVTILCRRFLKPPTMEELGITLQVTLKPSDDPSTYVWVNDKPKRKMRQISNVSEYNATIDMAINAAHISYMKYMGRMSSTLQSRKDEYVRDGKIGLNDATGSVLASIGLFGNKKTAKTLSLTPSKVTTQETNSLKIEAQKVQTVNLDYIDPIDRNTAKYKWWMTPQNDTIICYGIDGRRGYFPSTHVQRYQQYLNYINTIENKGLLKISLTDNQELLLNWKDNILYVEEKGIRCGIHFLKDSLFYLDVYNKSRKKLIRLVFTSNSKKLDVYFVGEW